MVQANVDGNENTWLNEGLSELSSNVTGDKRLGWIPEFFSQPETQLNTWGLGKNGRHYGAAFSFVGYFLQRFGDDALHKLVNEPDNGFQSVRKTLLAINATDPQTSKPVTLEDFFADWTNTNLLNNKQVGDGRFAYTIFKQIPPTPTLIDTLISNAAQPIKTNQWEQPTYPSKSRANTPLNSQASRTWQSCPQRRTVANGCGGAPRMTAVIRA